MNAQMVKVSSLRANDVEFHGPIVFLNAPFQYWMRQGENVYDEALRDPPPPEDLTPKFRSEDLDRDPDQKIFVHVARSFEEMRGCRWMARKLKIDSPTMSKLHMWHQNNVQEMSYQIMVAWKRIHPAGRVRDLVKALCESRNQKQCLALKAFLEENY